VLAQRSASCGKSLLETRAPNIRQTAVYGRGQKGLLELPSVALLADLVAARKSPHEVLKQVSRSPAMLTISR